VMFLTVSRIVRCGPYCSRFSVGSMWRKVKLGNCFFRIGNNFIGRESCSRSGFPKVRIFILRDLVLYICLTLVLTLCLLVFHYVE